MIFWVTFLTSSSVREPEQIADTVIKANPKQTSGLEFNFQTKTIKWQTKKQANPKQWLSLTLKKLRFLNLKMIVLLSSRVAIEPKHANLDCTRMFS